MLGLDFSQLHLVNSERNCACATCRNPPARQGRRAGPER